MLSNPRSDRVRAVRALSGRSARTRYGQLLVEGPQAVREAVRYAADRVVDLYLTPAAAQRYPEIVEAASGLHLHLADPQVVAAMSGDAQGVVAVANTRRVELAQALADSAPRLVAVLANVRDPGNAGTVIRAADAAGAGLVVLAGESVDPDNPKVVRSTAGSLFHLPVVTGVSVADAIGDLRGAGLAVLAADGSGTLDLDDLLDAVREPPGASDRGSRSGHGHRTDLATRTAWLFGNEAWGLREEDLRSADAAVRVPIHGLAESLNLATAAAVCLYASAWAQRSRRTVPRDDAP